jgi:hypothetical protein
MIDDDAANGRYVEWAVRKVSGVKIRKLAALGTTSGGPA